MVVTLSSFQNNNFLGTPHLLYSLIGLKAISKAFQFLCLEIMSETYFVYISIQEMDLLKVSGTARCSDAVQVMVEVKVEQCLPLIIQAEKAMIKKLTLHANMCGSNDHCHKM